MAEQSVQNALGAAVRARREELGLLQSECARRAGVSVTSLSLIENGRKGARFVTFWALASALELEPAELARRVGGMLLALGGGARSTS